MGFQMEAGLPTSLQKATYQFPKIYNYIRALATPRKGHWAPPFARVRKSSSARSRVTLEILSFRVSVGTLKKLIKLAAMSSDVRPEDEESNMEKNEKQIDDFYSYVAVPFEGNPFREHWSRSRHLPSCGHRVFGAGTSCSCCVGSMTFATADNFVNDMLKQPDDEGKVCKNLTDMARPSMIGLSNLATIFGFGTNKAAFNAAFGTGNDSDGNRHENVLWGTNGVVRTRPSTGRL